MNKELNPALFSQQAMEPSRETNSTLTFDPGLVFRSDRHIDKIEHRKLEERVALINDRSQEALKTMSLKTEKLVQKHLYLEQRLDALIGESRAKYAQLSGKLTEKGLHEVEIQSLLERHNQLVRNFESRLGQMQKVVDSQQMQLMNYASALEDARREIAKLKRL